MLLRITSYAIRERTGGDFHLRTVYKDSLIEVVDLLLQFNGVVVSVAFRSKYRLMLRLVSAQHQQVGDIQKLEIKQYIFSFFACETTAQNMRNYGETAFSFEILPPLKGTGIEKLYQTVDTLREFDPKYINITTHRSEYVYKDLGNGLFQRNRLRRLSFLFVDVVIYLD